MKTVVLPIAVLCCSLFAASTAMAWSFHEHQALGRKAYLLACAEFELFVDRLRSDDVRRTKAKILCPKRTLEQDATKYGRLVAFSGDHFSDPENLETVEGELESDNPIEFLRLALTNAEHFWPGALRNWTDIQLKALDRASTASGAPTAVGRVQGYKTVFFFSAFASHFLQDAFSVGHSGFSRPNSPPNASKAFHDHWNETGRIMADSSGRQWKAFGDEFILDNDILTQEKKNPLTKETEKAVSLDLFVTTAKKKIDVAQSVRKYLKLCEETKSGKADKGDPIECIDEGIENIIRILKANQAAIIEVLLAFINGAPGNDDGTEILELFPRFTQVCQKWETDATKECWLDKDKIWMDLEDPFPANVYRQYSIGIGALKFDTFDVVEGKKSAPLGFNFAANFWPWPENLRWSYSRYYGSFFIYDGLGILISFPVKYGDLATLEILSEVNNLTTKDDRKPGIAEKLTGRKIKDTLGLRGEVRLSLEAAYFELKLGLGLYCQKRECFTDFEPTLFVGLTWSFGIAGGGTNVPVPLPQPHRIQFQAPASNGR